MGTHILAGDIGGTKTKLAIYELGADQPHPIAEQIYASQNYPRFADLIAEFRTTHDTPLETACLGVAGPVHDGRCVTTNLPWDIDETSFESSLGVRRAKLLNDLEAMALGMLALPPASFVELNPDAVAVPGNKAVIAAGTGCGEALLCWDGKDYRAVATEGGHGDFAPNTEEQDALLRYLRGRFGGHVSYERLLSGPGIFNIYQFLRDRDPSQESLELNALLASGADPGQVVGEWGCKGRDALCSRAVNLFAQIYGAEAGNMALRTLAVSGVLVGGGIAPKLLPVLSGGEFLRAFRDKGRFASFMGSVSVKVALHPDVGLLGAAAQAEQLVDG